MRSAGVLHTFSEASYFRFPECSWDHHAVRDRRGVLLDLVLHRHRGDILPTRADDQLLVPRIGAGGTEIEHRRAQLAEARAELL